MVTLDLYHGSQIIIQKPEFGKGKINNDYGQGFYCTENISLAKEWACTENSDGYVNHYKLNTKNLSILNLSDNNFTILNWFSILIENRELRLSTPIAKRGKEWLLANFLPDYKNYDLIIGYRADDSYFSFVRSFLSNEISLSQLSYAMKLGKLGEQIVLKSQKAFERITFCDYEIAENHIYYEKRIKRDNSARKAYFESLEKEDLNGLFMRDILQKEIKANDSRL